MIFRKRVSSTVKDKFWAADEWRGAPANAKQGSSDDIIEHDDVKHAVTKAYTTARWAYNLLVHRGVCREQARTVLPLGCYTEWYWTGSLYAFSRVYRLRSSSTAQQETAEVARELGKCMSELFPVSWDALTRDIPSE